ncbi:MAG: YidC/Oxa1 family membrane protein insertase [Deinococcota bacterium]|nr:YidC/Oxa1 family membrane protein insertase [Deinococcota bacterium]
MIVVIVMSAASARVEFDLQTIHASELRELERFAVNCEQPATASFWCSNQGETLQLVTTKGIDVLFNDAGEIVALYSKPQKGADLGRNYNLSDGQNLIPADSTVPGGAVLIGGLYSMPEDARSEWRQVAETQLQGSFEYSVGDYLVNKTIAVYFTQQTMDVSFTVPRDAATRGAAADDEVAGETTAETTGETTGEIQVQYVMPGVARQTTPTIKVGQAGQYSLNPVSAAIANPSYISLQTANNNRDHALIMRPVAQDGELAAMSLPPRQIAMMKTLEGGEQSVSFDLQVYGGRNELVRYHQEGYRDLPGLFEPNLLGRLSLGIIMVLEAIHGVVLSWGLSIIVLTLLIRILIWPLIATQTKSMVGMQQIQPKMQALQKKYKDNREKLTQETMKLYKEAGVNPAGGCLPIFAQMPIFIMLWQVFMNYEFAEGFLWVPDLGLYDPTYILPILYIGVMVGYSFLMAKGNPQSLKMQLMINLVFIFFIIRFPAGVTLYWVASMLVQVFQHWVIQRQMAVPVPVKAKPQGSK